MMRCSGGTRRVHHIHGTSLTHPPILRIPYSAYISRVFNFANLESFAKLFQRNFLHFEVEPHWRRIEQRIGKIISNNFLKTAIRENLDHSRYVSEFNGGTSRR